MNNVLKKAIAFTLVLCMLIMSVPSIYVYAADKGPGQYRVSVTTTLSLRSGPGTSYSRLDYIPDGVKLIVSETADGWGKTEYNGKAGWVSLDYAIYIADNSGNEVSSDQLSDIVRIAQGELGYKEGPNNYTKYGVWYSSVTKNAPWCAIFVCWCAYQAGIPESIIPRFSFCGTGVQLFTNMNAWHDPEGYTPKKGDIIFFKTPAASSPSDHVGIVLSSDDTYVYTIEGNSSDAVSERKYDMSDPKSYILGYATPKYATVPTTTTTSATATSAPASSSDVTVTSTSGTGSSTASNSASSGSTTTATSSATTASGTTASSSVISSTSATTTGSTTTATSTTKTTTTTKTTSTTTSATTTTASTTSSTVPTTQPSGKKILTVTGSVVNVRAEAKTGSARIGAVRSGNVFEVLGSSKDSSGTEWYKITFKGDIGYISGQYVSVSYAQTGEQNGSSENETTRGVIVVTGSTVNIRSGAGTSYSRIGKAVRGDVLTVAGSKSVNGITWYIVDYNGQTGYISGEYSKMVESVTVTGAIVNVRAEAGASGSRVGSVRKGQSFDLLGCKEADDGTAWYKIQWNGQTVYICADYAKIG